MYSDDSQIMQAKFSLETVVIKFNKNFDQKCRTPFTLTNFLRKNNYSNTVRASFKAAACIFSIPLFTAVYNEEQLMLQTIYALNKEILQKIHGFKSREGYKNPYNLFI